MTYCHLLSSSSAYRRLGNAAKTKRLSNPLDGNFSSSSSSENGPNHLLPRLYIGQQLIGFLATYLVSWEHR